MAPSPRMLHLNAHILDSGRHNAAWRLADRPDTMTDIDSYVALLRIAERGKLDAVFFADGVQLTEDFADRPWHALDPIVLLSALATATSHVGLIGTASTTFNSPFNIARRFASLDHVSKGRAGWNIVTSRTDAAAANFSFDALPDHASRYERAEEFTEIVVKLWDSFEDGAVVADQAAGRYVDRSKVHSIDHKGAVFSVAGPINVPRGPQGRPVMLQAGDSPVSRRFGSRWADAVFTVQRTVQEAQTFYSELKGMARANGRDPDQLLILPGLYPVIGSTQEEALRRKAEMDSLLDLKADLLKLAGRLNVEPERLQLDRPIPDDVDGVGGTGPGIAFTQNLLREARLERLTVRELLGRNPFGGHRLIVGTPEQLADEMESWFRTGAADGFNLNMDAFPSGLELFVDHVVPELQRRGLFRREYEGTTLRDHLGLDRPASQYQR